MSLSKRIPVDLSNYEEDFSSILTHRTVLQEGYESNYTQTSYGQLVLINDCVHVLDRRLIVPRPVSKELSYKVEKPQKIALIKASDLVGIPSEIANRYIAVDTGMLIANKTYTYIVLRKGNLHFSRGNELRGVHTIIGRVIYALKPEFIHNIPNAS